MENKDGGPAFPHDSIRQNAGGFAEPEEGMSLRDWFAGQALTARGQGEYNKWEDLASDCYAIADAMIKEKRKP